MYCNKCGKPNPESGKFCKHCGVKFNNVVKDNGIGKEDSSEQISVNPKATKKSFNVGGIIKIFVVLVIIGFVIYGSQDSGSVTTNNNAITSFDSGDSKTAIDQFQQATKDATGNDTKISTLTNLAYVYASEDQNDLALSTFKEALALTSEGTFDYYLISGEVALLEGKPNGALLSYNKAYQINPDDFQINNALALFYLDLEKLAPQYTDYKKALTYAQKAYDLNKSLSLAKHNLAIAYYFNENYTQTISLLSSSNFIQHLYTAYWLGLAYFNIEDHANAKIYFQKAIDGGFKVPQEIYDYLNSN